MKVLLNGATGGTNFGDFLFAKIFHETVSSLVGEENTFWYESRYCLSDFYKRHLGYKPRKYNLDDIDALVCISGGYFCGGDKTLREYIIRYFRYFHLCMRCIFRKIPIAIIGVEVAKPKLWLMDFIQKFILQRAELVVVRNKESLEQLKRYRVKNPICTVDTAHVINASMFEKNTVQHDVSALEGKKLFFHVQLSAIDVAKQIIPVINHFLLTHPEYSVVVGLDQYLEKDDCLIDIKERFSCPNVVINHYDDPMDLCKALSFMDLIVTPKLHVGIVGATLSKSVVSFSIHTEKISRFYNQIGENGRSLSMDDFTEDEALAIMEKYHNVPISLSTETIKVSQSNLEILKEFICKYSK